MKERKKQPNTTAKSTYKEWYAEEHILKIWEQYTKSDGKNLVISLFKSSSPMSISTSSAIIVDGASAIHRNAKGESITICRTLEYLNESNYKQTERFEDRFKNALQQIKSWNDNTNVRTEEQISSHIIIFPYLITPGHWAFGKIKLELATNEITAQIYNPKPIFGGNQFSVQVSDTIKNCYKDVFGVSLAKIDLNPPKDYPQQQFDAISCGVIISENGKCFIDGKNDITLQIQYKDPEGIKTIRLKHIKESKCGDAFINALQENVRLKQVELPEDTEEITKLLEKVFSELKITKDNFMDENTAVTCRDIIKEYLKYFREIKLASGEFLIKRLFDQEKVQVEDEEEEEGGGEMELTFKDGTRDVLEAAVERIYEPETKAQKELDTILKESSFEDRFKFDSKKFQDISPLDIDSLFKHNHKEISKKMDKARQDAASIIRNKNLSNKAKLEELNKLDEKEYGSILVKIGQPKNKDDYKTLVKLFNNIAEITFEIGHIKREIKDHQDRTTKPNPTALNKSFNNSDADYLKSYTDSAVCYQHVITILNKNLKDVPGSYRELGIDNPYKRLDEIQKLIIDSVSRNKSANEEAIKINTQKDVDKIAHCDQLTKLREQVKDDIKLIDKVKGRNDKYITKSRETFEYVTEGMQNYLASIYKYAENIVGKPPCAYSVIGMGSMALKQITPYSDLEFAIITENEEYKCSHDPKVRDYFKNLSHYAHFMVICLGETVMPNSKYKEAGQREDTNYLVPKAVKFDLGGKTPLGRIDKDKPYELIKTVKYMMQYVRNEGEKAEHIDKNLPYILEKTSHVYGDQNLTTEYQGEVKKFLFTPMEEGGKTIMPCEARAKKAMLEGVTEVDYWPSSNNYMKKNHIKGDLEKFNFSSVNEGSKIFDVKQEIYRLPDRLIYNMGSCFGVQGKSAWDTVEQLQSKGIICKAGAKNLLYAVSFATTLRLKTYSYHESQKEKMSVNHRIDFDPKQQDQEIEREIRKLYRLEKEDLEDGGFLHQYYFVTIALHKNIRDLYEIQVFYCSPSKSKMSFVNDLSLFMNIKKGYLSNEIFYSNSAKNKWQISLRIGNKKEELKYLLEELENIEEQDDFELKKRTGEILYNIGATLASLDRHEESVAYWVKAQACLSEIFGVENPFSYLCLSGIAGAMGKLGEYSDAISIFQKILPVQKKKLGKEHKEIAITLYNIGGMYYYLDNLEQAKFYVFQAIVMFKKLNVGKTTNAAAALLTLGCILEAQGEYKEALPYKQQALETFKEIYGVKSEHVAYCFSELSRFYLKFGDYRKALSYERQALEILKEISLIKEASIAHSQNNIGIIYQELGKYDKALSYYEQSLATYKNVLGESHRLIGVGLNNLGSVHGKLGNYEKELFYKLEALEVMKEVLGEIHPDLVAIWTNLGQVYANLENNNEALKCLLKAQELAKGKYGEMTPEVATIYNNISMTYAQLGNCTEAISFQEKALEIRQKILGKNDPYTAQSCSNLGLIYNKIQKYEIGTTYLEKAIAIRKLVLPINHPYIMSTLQNLLEAYLKLGVQKKEPIKYTYKAYNIYKDVAGEDHAITKELSKTICNIEKSHQGFDAQNIKHEPSEDAKIHTSTIKQDLWQAVKNNNSELFEQLLQENTISNQDLDIMIAGRTPLINAISNGNEVMVTTLLALGANVNKASDDKASPLYYAAGYASEVNLQIIDLLLANGADVNQPMNDGGTPMHMAAYGVRADVMKKLLAKGANINTPNLEGKTPFCVLVESGTSGIDKDVKISAVKFLLANGATIDACKYAETPILELVAAKLPELLMDMAIQLSTEDQVDEQSVVNTELHAEPIGEDSGMITET